MSRLQTEQTAPPISLQNDGELDLIFIGTGTAFSIEDGHTNFFIVKGEHHILVDFGSTGPTQLARIAGLSPVDVATFLPTHAHADHVGGLEALAIFNRYQGVLSGDRPKLRIILHETFRENLWEMTLRGGLGFNEPGMGGELELFDLYFDVVNAAPMLDGRGCECWEVEDRGLRLRLIRTAHTQGKPAPDGTEFYTHALLIDDRIFFSGDTTFDPELLEEHARDADLIIHDAGIVETPLHPTIDQLRGLPAEMKQKMLLVHYPPAARDLDVSDFLGFVEAGVRYRLTPEPVSAPEGR